MTERVLPFAQKKAPPKAPAELPTVGGLRVTVTVSVNPEPSTREAQNPLVGPIDNKSPCR